MITAIRSKIFYTVITRIDNLWQAPYLRGMGLGLKENGEDISIRKTKIERR